MCMYTHQSSDLPTYLSTFNSSGLGTAGGMEGDDAAGALGFVIRDAFELVTLSLPPPLPGLPVAADADSLIDDVCCCLLLQ